MDSTSISSAALPVMVNAPNMSTLVSRRTLGSFSTRWMTKKATTASGTHT